MGVEFGRIMELMPDITKAFGETVYMIGIALVVALIIGLPLGIILFVTDKDLFWENAAVKSILGFIVNMIRSIPFIILLVAITPLTKIIAGSPIGPTAASVSLSVAAIPFLQE